MKTNTFLPFVLKRLLRFIGIPLFAGLIVALMMPATTFSQATAPPLGTAANFGVLAQAAISGTSVVVGNVGTLSGAIDGTITAPGYTVYPVNDPVVQTANADLLIAYNDAAGQPFTTLSGGLLTGILTTGVYRLSAATPNLPGTVTLDGGGVFIFQASSTLITSDGSSVLLTNGTVWSNVYWQVGSSATLGANSTFEGTIMANTSITVGASASVTGRILAGAVTATGAVTLGSNVLPVELTSFTAALNNGAVELKWNTATEVNNYGFEVQRSETQNYNWTKIGFVNGSGNSNSPNEYSFTDKTISYGSYAYRLKQLDNDGAHTYSDVIEVNAAQILNGFLLNQNYPNPFNPSTQIQFSVNKNTHATLTVFNVLGVKVSTLFNGNAAAGQVYNVTFNGDNLASGIYYYKLQTNEKNEVRKMILMR
jgi:hypothetical protein